jgi:hypothetical protein
MQAPRGERKYSYYSFLTSVVDGVSGQRQGPTAHYPRETTPGTHWIGRWVGLRTGQDNEATVKIPLPLPGIDPRSSSL